MSFEISKPVTTQYWVAYTGNIVHYGSTAPNQVTTTGQSTFEYSANEDDQLAVAADLNLPPLPDEGELINGYIYLYNNAAYKVRQTHVRTLAHGDPSTLPALFLFVRAPGEGVEWVAGEQVYVGTVRTYNGVDYTCIQTHVTQSDWVPPAVPNLWEVVVVGPEWQAGVSYTIGDIVTYQGVSYECRQSHTSQVGWEPPNVLSLWLPL